MMSKVLKVVLALVIGLFLYQMFFKNAGAIHGEKAPNIETNLVDGKAFALQDLEGQYVLLDFWASWCGPCFRDLPYVVKLHEKYNGKSFTDASGFDVVSVALEKSENRWQKAVERFGFTWDKQIVDQVQFVRLSSIASAYNVSQIPTKFLINPKGEIIGVNQSYEEIDAILSAKLR